MWRESARVPPFVRIPWGENTPILPIAGANTTRGAAYRAQTAHSVQGEGEARCCAGRCDARIRHGQRERERDQHSGVHASGAAWTTGTDSAFPSGPVRPPRLLRYPRVCRAISTAAVMCRLSSWILRLRVLLSPVRSAGPVHAAAGSIHDGGCNHGGRALRSRCKLSRRQLARVQPVSAVGPSGVSPPAVPRRPVLPGRPYPRPLFPRARCMVTILG